MIILFAPWEKTCIDVVEALLAESFDYLFLKLIIYEQKNYCGTPPRLKFWLTFFLFLSDYLFIFNYEHRCCATPPPRWQFWLIFLQFSTYLKNIWLTLSINVVKTPLAESSSLIKRFCSNLPQDPSWALGLEATIEPLHLLFREPTNINFSLTLKTDVRYFMAGWKTLVWSK